MKQIMPVVIITNTTSTPEYNNNINAIISKPYLFFNTLFKSMSLLEDSNILELFNLVILYLAKMLYFSEVMNLVIPLVSNTLSMLLHLSDISRILCLHFLHTYIYVQSVSLFSKHNSTRA